MSRKKILDPVTEDSETRSLRVMNTKPSGKAGPSRAHGNKEHTHRHEKKLAPSIPKSGGRPR